MTVVLPKMTAALRSGDSFDLECPLKVAGAREVEGQLHAEPRLRVEPKAFDRR